MARRTPRTCADCANLYVEQDWYTGLDLEYCLHWDDMSEDDQEDAKRIEGACPYWEGY